MTTSPTQGEHAQTEAMYAAAMEYAAEKASISYVQRKCRCSYNDAERMLERMVDEGIIETYGGRKTVATTPSQPAAPQGGTEAPKVYLSVNQLLQAIEFATGGAPANADELETSIGFQIGHSQDDDGKVIHGMRCWLADYPEEGVYPLDEEPTAKDLAAHALRASHGQAPAGATDWWRKRADEIEAQVAVTGSQEAMRCYTDMRTLLQAATAQPAPAATGVQWQCGPQANGFAAPAAGAVAGPNRFERTREVLARMWRQEDGHAANPFLPLLRRLLANNGSYSVDEILQLQYALDGFYGAAPTPAAQADSQPALVAKPACWIPPEYEGEYHRPGESITAYREPMEGWEPVYRAARKQGAKHD